MSRGMDYMTDPCDPDRGPHIKPVLEAEDIFLPFVDFVDESADQSKSERYLPHRLTISKSRSNFTKSKFLPIENVYIEFNDRLCK